jgi:hypothetical protein
MGWRERFREDNELLLRVVGHAGARLPQPVAVAVAMGNAIRVALAMGSAGEPLDLQRHQALGGKADHLAQQIGIQTLPVIRDDHRQAARSLPRYVRARALAACFAELHHGTGQDPVACDCRTPSIINMAERTQIQPLVGNAYAFAYSCRLRDPVALAFVLRTLDAHSDPACLARPKCGSARQIFRVQYCT